MTNLNTALPPAIILLFGLLAGTGCGSQEPQPADPISTHTTTTSQPEEVTPQTDESVLVIVQQPKSEKPSPPPKPVFVEPFFPYLIDETCSGSISIGTVTEGYLVKGKPLPLPGQTYEILPIQAQRGLIYGTNELIELIIGASLEINKKFPGSILYLGNIGDRGGGNISWSVSHNSGRDVDLSFYMLDSKGNLAPRPPDLLQLDKKGNSILYGENYRFDPARNWHLINYLLSHPTTQVQYIFVYKPLRTMLLDYAKKEGSSEEEINRAGSVLVQPRGAAAHDDHFHLRIYCAQDDVAGGCINKGRISEWAKLYKDERERTIKKAGNYLADTQGDLRLVALQRLKLLIAKSAHRKITGLLKDPEIRIRSEAVRTLIQFSSSKSIDPLIAAYREEIQPEVLAALILGISKLGSKKATNFLTEISLSEKRTLKIKIKKVNISFLPLSVLALRGLARRDSKKPVNQILPLLEADNILIRSQTAETLSHLTNRTDGFDWLNEVDPKLLEQWKNDWEKWYKKHRKESRNKWLIRGFKERGFTIKKLNRKAIPQLLWAILDRPHISYNAQKVLMKISGKKAKSLEWSAEDAAWYWSKYFIKRKKKYKLKKVPDLKPKRFLFK